VALRLGNNVSEINRLIAFVPALCREYVKLLMR
jgi:hypothetical protein